MKCAWCGDFFEGEYHFHKAQPHIKFCSRKCVAEDPRTEEWQEEFENKKARKQTEAKEAQQKAQQRARIEKFNNHVFSLFEGDRPMNPDHVSQLFQQGADVDMKNKSGWSLMHLLCFSSKADLPIAKFLIRSRANINARGPRKYTPLHIATSYGEVEMVTLLLANGADKDLQQDEGWTALALTCGEDAPPNSNQVAKILIANGADINIQNRHGWTPLLLAANSKQPEIAKALIAAGAEVNIQNEDGWTPLHLTARDGQTEVAKALIAAGAEVNAPTKGGWIPLHHAVFNRQKAVLKLLLDAGADVHATTKDGWTPLGLTCVKGMGDPELAKILLKHGADIEAAGGGWPPLARAADEGHTALLEVLIAHGSKLDSLDPAGETAIFWGARNGHLETVKLLHRAGANLMIKSPQGQLAIVVAHKYKHPEIVKYLKSHMELSVQDRLRLFL